MTIIRLQHSSGQFSDSRDEHAHDAKAIFDHATKREAWVVTGTESGESPVNHDLHDLIVKEAAAHNFAIYANRFGEWVAMNRSFLRSLRHGYEGPFIPGSHGLTAAQGGHSPRGVTWMQGQARGVDLGRITTGAAHYLTKRSIEGTGHTNHALQAGIGVFGKEFGPKGDKVFFAADTNMQDRRTDVFAGHPFTTCWDELGKHPSTGHGNIDIIASYDEDKRVSCKAARSLTDSDLRLYSDHFTIEATYEVRTK